VPVATRTRLDTERRRAQLIDVGLNLLGTRPYDEVSMDDVAREAGVSHGLVYHYFADKRELLIASLRHAAERMLAANVADMSKPAWERLKDGLRTHLGFAEAFPAGYALLVNGGNGADDEIRALCEDFRWEGLREILRSSGIEEPTPALRIALRGWQGFQEGAILEYLKRRDLEREAMIEMLAQALGAAFALADASGISLEAIPGHRDRPPAAS